MGKIFDAAKTKSRLIDWIKEQFDRNNGKLAVLGISGGADSSIMAALLVEALGKESVIGVLMPNGEQKDIADSYRVVNHLGIRYIVANIKPAYDAVLDSIREIHIGDTDIVEAMPETPDQVKNNLAPRLRIPTVLYAVAQHFDGARVINTSNESEKTVGYFTRWGDQCGDLSPFGNLTKNEVVEIGKLCDLPIDLVVKTPSDGLVGMSDEEKLGVSYNAIHNWLRNRCEYNTSTENNKIYSLYEKNRFKTKEMPQFNDIIYGYSSPEHILVVVDYQNDFIDGSLGTNEAKQIKPAVMAKIKEYMDRGDQIYFTMDSHDSDYLDTPEGKKLPVEHCIVNTPGWQIESDVAEMVKATFGGYVHSDYDNVAFEMKNTFGSDGLVCQIRNFLLDDPERDVTIELIGLCTDICVVSNAIMIKNHIPYANVMVDAKCCAGVTPESHEAALNTMEMCQIEVIR